MMHNNENTPLLGHRPQATVTAVRLLTRVRLQLQDSRWRKFIVVPVLFCKMFSIGIYMFAVPEYVHEVLQDSLHVNQSLKYKYVPCQVNKTDPGYQQYKLVQTETSKWSVYFALASLIPALFANIIWGTYSDVIGRKIVFILCMSGQAFRLVGFTLVLYFKASFMYIVLSLVIDGLSGTFSTLWAITFSYLSDVTSSGKQRSTFMVITEVMMTITLTISVVVSGHLFKTIGYLYPMIISSTISVLGVILAVVLLPETLQSDILKRGEAKSFFKNISSAAKFYMKQDPPVKQAKYILLMLAFTFYMIPSIGRGNVEAVYQLGEPLCWSAEEIGLFGGLKIGLGSFVGLVGTYLLHKVCTDDTIVFFGMLSAMVAYTVEGLAKTNGVMYSVTAIGALCTTTTAMIRSVMSDLTPKDKQGALFASVAFVETCCTLLGALTMNFVYQATLSVFAGFVFILCAICMLVDILIHCVFMYIQQRYTSGSLGEQRSDEQGKITPNRAV